MNQEFLIKVLVVIMLALFFVIRNKFTRYYKNFSFKFLTKYIIVLIILVIYFSKVTDFAIIPLDVYFRLTWGFLFMGVGYVLFFSAHKTLGENWSSLIDKEVTRDKKLIQKGIYKYVRHPMYLTSFITLLGFGFLTANWLIFLVPFFILLIFYFYKVPREEKFLVKHFGKEYEKYRKMTGGFFPKFK